MTTKTVTLVELFELFGPAYRRHVGVGLPEGVSPARLRALSVLADRGPISMRELGLELQATAQNVTGLVDALESEGIVERRPHPQDRRVTLISLSEGHAAAIKRQRQQHRQEVAQLFEVLTDHEREVLARSLTKLNAALEQRQSKA
jgi:DNA-binding MarR family transcriptional regulator